MYAGKRKVAVLIHELCEEWLKKQKPLPAPKQRKNAKQGTLTRMWGTCTGNKDKFRATIFYSEADARAGEAAFHAEKHFHEDVVFCAECSKNGNDRPVWHVRHHFSSDLVIAQESRPTCQSIKEWPATQQVSP